MVVSDDAQFIAMKNVTSDTIPCLMPCGYANSEAKNYGPSSYLLSRISFCTIAPTINASKVVQ